MTEPQSSGDRIALHSEDDSHRRRRFGCGLATTAVLALAAYGLFSLFSATAGVIAAAAVTLPLLYVVLYSIRRRMWLEGGTLVVRTFRTRRIDLATVRHIDLVISDLRGNQTVSLLVSDRAERRGGIKVDLALYSGTGGRELDVLALRKLANALVNNIDANGMVFSELLVAQLRAEAKGAPLEARPLHRLASAAPRGKLMQRFSHELVSKFVASLD